MQNTSSSHDIMTAAASLFAAYGYDGVSMTKVAQAAGISKSNIYHHFASKDELYLSVLRHACQDTLKMTEALQQAEGSITERLARFSSHHFQQLGQKSHITRLVLRELLDGGSEHGRMLAQEVFHEQFTHLKQLMQFGQQTKDIRSDIPADHMAAALVAMNLFLFQAWSVLEHLPDANFQHPEQSQHIMFDLLLHGLHHPTQGV